MGAQWSEFSPTTVIVVQQSTTVIDNFTLIDDSTGQAFSRPAGSTGTSDTRAPTCTGGPSMPGVTVCTTRPRPRSADHNHDARSADHDDDRPAETPSPPPITAAAEAARPPRLRSRHVCDTVWRFETKRLRQRGDPGSLPGIPEPTSSPAGRKDGRSEKSRLDRLAGLTAASTIPALLYGRDSFKELR